MHGKCCIEAVKIEWKNNVCIYLLTYSRLSGAAVVQNFLQFSEILVNCFVFSWISSILPKIFLPFGAVNVCQLFCQTNKSQFRKFIFLSN